MRARITSRHNHTRRSCRIVRTEKNLNFNRASSVPLRNAGHASYILYSAGPFQPYDILGNTLFAIKKPSNYVYNFNRVVTPRVGTIIIIELSSITTPVPFTRLRIPSYVYIILLRININFSRYYHILILIWSF